MKSHRDLVKYGHYICRTTDLCFDTAIHENHRINQLAGMIAVLYKGRVKGQVRWYNEVYELTRGAVSELALNKDCGVVHHRYHWREKGRNEILSTWRIRGDVKKAKR